MLRASALVVLACFSTLADAADPRQFPYQAAVVADNVEVRCGPGQRFYVTSLLKRDSRVIVHRHDHGGWYMIAPPEGSFSYVDASLIRQTASDRGIVHLPPVDGQPPARAIVWIGSSLGNEHGAYGRELSHGDEVTILGRATLDTRDGTLDLFKIVPPPQEFRWVKGDFIVPLDEQHRVAAANDPYQVPPSLRHQYVVQQKEDNKLPRAALSAPAELGPPREAAEADPVSSPREAAFGRLDEIDQEYARMMQADPTSWNLDVIEGAYHNLQKTAPEPIPVLIGQRLEAIAARREIAERYQRFVQLTSATSQRDAELASMQAMLVQGTGQVDASYGSPADDTFLQNGTVIAPWEQLGVPAADLGAAHSLDAAGTPTTSLPALPAPSELASSPYVEEPAPSVSTPPAGPAPGAPGSPASGPGIPEDVHPRLNGAGIIQPVYPPVPGLPPYRLIAPDGRLLAFLDPERHVPLQQWVGTAAGIIGRRFRDPRLGADVIRVQRIVPVQLTE